MSKVKETLEERGTTYGDFATIAKFTNQLQQTVRDFTPYEKEIPDHMQLAINMILHKIVRAVNGDSTYVDNWVDIAGYATLVADELAKATTKRRYVQKPKKVIVVETPGNTVITPPSLEEMSRYDGAGNTNYGFRG